MDGRDCHGAADAGDEAGVSVGVRGEQTTDRGRDGGKERLSITAHSVNLSLSLSFSPFLCLAPPDAVLSRDANCCLGISRSAVAAMGDGTVGERVVVGVAVLHGGDG